jgi:hypothetical protein
MSRDGGRGEAPSFNPKTNTFAPEIKRDFAAAQVRVEWDRRGIPPPQASLRECGRLWRGIDIWAGHAADLPTRSVA